MNKIFVKLTTFHEIPDKRIWHTNKQNMVRHNWQKAHIRKHITIINFRKKSFSKFTGTHPFWNFQFPYFLLWFREQNHLLTRNSFAKNLQSNWHSEGKSLLRLRQAKLYTFIQSQKRFFLSEIESKGSLNIRPISQHFLVNKKGNSVWHF